MSYYINDGFKVMSQHKNKSGMGTLAGPVVLGLSVVATVIAVLMYGNDIVLLNPKGAIAEGQARLIIFVTVVLLAVAVPTLTLLYFFAWKYRETNEQAKRTPPKHQRKFSSFSFWVIPSAVLLLLASVMIPATHKLDPHNAIASDVKPLKVQVIALQWKWLFIYPEQDIATVNYVQIPVNTPVQFELTADDAPMNSFWIPHLGGQLYAMTGHSNRLNLMADTQGDFVGQAAEINGPGFAGMKFTARATGQDDFDEWVRTVKETDNSLTVAQYKKLLIPTENVPPAFFSNVQANPYGTVLLKYGDHSHHGGQE